MALQIRQMEKKTLGHSQKNEELGASSLNLEKKSQVL